MSNRACTVCSLALLNAIAACQLFLARPPLHLPGAPAEGGATPLQPPTRSPPIHSLYLNLDGRPDRRRAIESSFAGAGWAGLERFPAVNGTSDPRVSSLCPANESPRAMAKWGSCAGRTGCKLSHIGALRLAEARGYPVVGIFEDDLVLDANITRGTLQPLLLGAMARITNWDVIVLSGRYRRASRDASDRIPLGDGVRSVIRVYKTILSTAYIVKASYIPTLARNMEACDTARGLAIDVCWADLHASGAWYGVRPVVGLQSRGFSDLRGVVMKQWD